MTCTEPQCLYKGELCLFFILYFQVHRHRNPVVRIIRSDVSRSCVISLVFTVFNYVTQQSVNQSINNSSSSNVIQTYQFQMSETAVDRLEACKDCMHNVELK
jgi:hypothetical protein